MRAQVAVAACIVAAFAIAVGTHADERPPRSRALLARTEPSHPRKWPYLVYSEDFDGPAGSSPRSRVWNFDTGESGWGSEELQDYTSATTNAALNGHGQLVLTARAEPPATLGGSPHYTSARLQTLHKFQFAYGLVEARIKVPIGQGLLPAFWMLGSNAYQTDGWPQCGEIDVMEVLGSQPDLLRGTLHGPWPELDNQIGDSIRDPAPLSSAFHIYGVEWEPERVSFLLDGRIYGTLTPEDLPPDSPWPFQHPFFLLLDLAVGGRHTGAPGASTRFPARMLVDWIRVWQGSSHP